MRAAIFSLVLLAACADVVPDGAPKPTAVVPAFGANDASVAVRIDGRFSIAGRLHLSGPQTASVDSAFRAWLGDVELEQVSWTSPADLTAVVPAGLPAGAYALRVVGPGGAEGSLADAYLALSAAAPRLTGSAAVSPLVTSVGGELTVTAAIRNEGTRTVRDIEATLFATVDSTAGISLVAAPAAFALEPAQTANMEWRVEAAAAGQASIRLGFAGTEDVTTALVTLEVEAGAVQVERPAALGATLTSSPATVNVGQTFAFSVEANNTGEAAADSAAATLAQSGAGAVTVSTGPTPPSAVIAGGGTQTFSWELTGAQAGEADLLASVSAVDTHTAQTTTAATTPVRVTIQHPAALSAVIDVPAALLTDTDFLVSLAVTNTGGALATSVAPSVPSATGTAAVTLVEGPTPADVTLEGGASATFSWTYRATSEGSVAFSTLAAGVDANDQRTVSSPEVASASAMVTRAEVGTFLDDPFGDGTAVAFLFSYGGKVYLAPNATGTAAVRFNPDGSAPESVSFTLPRDVNATGTVAGNAAGGPYPSIGAPGCTADTSACGPDNEDARALFFSGTLAGVDWLVAGGGRTAGDLDYVYMTSDADPLLDFSYVDVSAVLQETTHALTAGHVFSDRTYLGFSDSGATTPMLLALTTQPAAGGLEAVAGADVVDLAAAASALGQAPTVDAITDYAGLLYVANARACLRSTVAQPRRYTTAQGDWAVCTPSASPYGAKASVTTSKRTDLEPADRAFPAMATFSGTFFAARNTTAGPQLWRCAPELSEVATACDPNDWSLVAPNQSGDAELTQFANTANTHLGVLAATSSALYVGFDSPSGVQLFRTATVGATSAADFTGEAGCSADLHPTGCQGLGGAGLGAGATRLFGGLAVSSGGVDYLYLVGGDGVGPLRVFRVEQ